MKSIFTVILALAFSSISANAQYLVSSEIVANFTAAELNLVPGFNAEYDIEMYKIVYNTVDAVGDATIASGAFARPLSGNCFGFPMVIYSHGTTLNKENVPSRVNSESQISNFLGGLGYYSLAPDYIGMGDSPGLHPYQHAQSEATANVDMIRAVRELLVTLDEQDNGELFITGYSQGGHAAMATHKYIEENDLLAEFNVIASGPASGAYDMSGSQTEVILSGEPYSNPGYIVYVMSSFELAYGTIYDTYSDILQSPYDDIVVPFFNGNNTTLSMNDLNPQLPAVITDLMTASEYSAFEADPAHPLRAALADNDVYDWTPQRNVRMYYCTLDEQVDFSNSTTAVTTMQANGAPDVTGVELGPLDHGNCYFPAMLGAVNYFNSVRTECQPSSVDEYSLISVSVSPNPASDRLNVKSGSTIESYVITDAAGKIVSNSGLKQSSSSYGDVFEISIIDLNSGMYRLIVTGRDGTKGVTSFVK
jgi:pimeloyl-ACP methyl ester carboxylesterase